MVPAILFELITSSMLPRQYLPGLYFCDVKVPYLLKKLHSANTWDTLDKRWH